MSTAETFALLEAAQSGDEEAGERVLRENTGLIWSVVRRYNGRGVETEDLYQLGCIGFLKAVKGFDLTYGTQFSTYAVPMIMGEIKRYLRDDGYVKVSRTTKTMSCKIAYYIDSIKNSEDRSPSIEEIAQKFGIEPQEVVFTMDSSKIPVSIYDKGDDEQGQSIYEKLTDGDPTDATIDKMLIKDSIEKLDERERKIVYMRYYKDKTQSEVAKVLNVSQVQVSRLETKIIEKLRESFK